MIKSCLQRAALVACLAGVAIPAPAAVSFDATTGTGFAGNGDVQSAFDWKNREYQSGALAVSFRYEWSATYRAVCSSADSGLETVYAVTARFQADVASAVVQRAGKHIDGHVLTGFLNAAGDGAMPVVGERCDAAGAEGRWSNVLRIESANVLYARYGGDEHAILSGTEKVTPYW